METQSLASSSVTFTDSSNVQNTNVQNTQFSLDQSLASKPKYKETETKYRVSIKLTNKLDLQQLLTD